MSPTSKLGHGVLSPNLTESPQLTTSLTVSEVTDSVEDEDGKTPRSPLTLALLRSRWYAVWATPGHARGIGFTLGGPDV